jgi:hypothetical protein
MSDEYEDFDVDLKHLMENIREHYSIPIEEAVIVENVDNCIDECYYSIHFKLDDDFVEILMLGDGMEPQVFWNILTKIAATTKFDERRKSSLGRYGWGMKISMCVADQVLIETKKDSFQGAQSWKLVNGIPKRKKEEPKISVDKNFTCVIIKLSDEYKSKFNREFVEKTLQKFYPTILSGAKVYDKNGRKRQLTMSINFEIVNPPPEIDYEKKKPLETKISGVDVTGYVFLAKERLNEEDQGIKIIVNGRKITKDFFGVYGSKNERITGYLHADILIDDIAGDKTSIKKGTSRWRQLSEAIGKQLIEFMKEIGAIREEKLPEKMIRQIQLEINDLLKHFPELQELAKRAGISISGDVLIPKQAGDISTKLEPGSQLDRGLEPGSGGGSGIPVQLGVLPNMASSNKAGEAKATTERRRRRGLVVWPRPEETVREEAWFSPGEGMVIVNSLFPTYRKAEKMGSLSYHMLRCAIEALLNHAVEIGIIDVEKIKEYRNNVLAKWGEL